MFSWHLLGPVSISTIPYIFSRLPWVILSTELKVNPEHHWHGSIIKEWINEWMDEWIITYSLMVRCDMPLCLWSLLTQYLSFTYGPITSLSTESGGRTENQQKYIADSVPKHESFPNSVSYKVLCSLFYFSLILNLYILKKTL